MSYLWRSSFRHQNLGCNMILPSKNHWTTGHILRCGFDINIRFNNGSASNFIQPNMAMATQHGRFMGPENSFLYQHPSSWSTFCSNQMVFWKFIHPHSSPVFLGQFGSIYLHVPFFPKLLCCFPPLYGRKSIGNPPFFQRPWPPWPFWLSAGRCWPRCCWPARIRSTSRWLAP